MADSSLPRSVTCRRNRPGFGMGRAGTGLGRGCSGAPALRSAFTAEPLWVDLSDTQLDNRGPVLPADRIAAVAAPIRSMPKDSLIGEHLREHRRVMRLAESSIADLVVLTGLAIAASLVAISQRDTAIRQRDRAIASQIALEGSQLPASAASLGAQLDIVANQHNAQGLGTFQYLLYLPASITPLLDARGYS